MLLDINYASAGTKAKLFRNFADTSRLAILEALRPGARSVSQAGGDHRAGAAEHLQPPRMPLGCGLVSREQQGRHAFYAISDPRVDELLDRADVLARRSAPDRCRVCPMYRPGASMTRDCLPFLAVGLVASAFRAQEPMGRVIVSVRSEAGPVDRAEVRSAGILARTDRMGEATSGCLPASRELSVRKLGFTPTSIRLSVRSGADTTITVQLFEQPEEEIIVSSTRTGQRIEDEPNRVEVLAREEVEEKMLMTRATSR